MIFGQFCSNYRKGSVEPVTDFNANQHIPASITADVQILIESEFSCTINNWQNVPRSGVAN